MSTHNKTFHGEIRKIFTWLPQLIFSYAYCIYILNLFVLFWGRKLFGYGNYTVKSFGIHECQRSGKHC